MARETDACGEISGRTSRILQVWDTQWVGLECGSAKLCFASMATETRLASDKSIANFQEFTLSPPTPMV